MKILDAVCKVLLDESPLDYKVIAERIINQGLFNSKGKTFEISVNALISKDIQTHGQNSKFVRVARGEYGLRKNFSDDIAITSRNEDAPSDVEDMEGLSEVGHSSQRVRVPWFPIYNEVRVLLRIWQNFQEKDVLGLQSTMHRFSGTPRDQRDWKNPTDWIPIILDGDDYILANTIWKESKHKINPRYIRGHWRLCKIYNLLEPNNAGVLSLTADGKDFADNENGNIVKQIDMMEGIFKLLSIVESREPTRFSNMTADWKEYLLQNTMIRSPSFIRDTLRQRLNNLIDRCLVKRENNMYSLTQPSENYLSIEDPENYQDDDQASLKDSLKEHNRKVRDNLLNLLKIMDPSELEHLVKNLLEAMGYQNVEVTKPSGDGGVDVVGYVEVGVTSVKEVIQVKRHKRPISRPVVDALRGSLGRYDAIRGTIVTTSRFSKDAIEEVTKKYGAPITLIDGEKLVDLMIEYQVGVSKQNVHILVTDSEAFSESG